LLKVPFSNSRLFCCNFATISLKGALYCCHDKSGKAFTLLSFLLLVTFGYTKGIITPDFTNSLQPIALAAKYSGPVIVLRPLSG